MHTTNNMEQTTTEGFFPQMLVFGDFDSTLCRRLSPQGKKCLYSNFLSLMSSSTVVELCGVPPTVQSEAGQVNWQLQIVHR